MTAMGQWGSSALTQTSKRRCVMGAAVQCGVGEDKIQTTTTTTTTIQTYK